MSDLKLEVWKKSRESVEHFDKILGDFRKIIVTIDVAMVPFVYQITQTSNEWPFYLFVIGLAWNMASLLIWIAEKHYHLYLLAAAEVAKRIEMELELPVGQQLTSQLAIAKKRQFHVPIFFKKIKLYFYDFFYICFGVVGLGLTLYSGWKVFVGIVLIEISVLCIVLHQQHSAENSVV